MDEMINPSSVKGKGSSTGFEAPFDVIELPSKGKLYRGTTLEGRDTLEVFYLTASHENILTSPNLIKNGKMLDVLMRGVLKDGSVNPDDLLIGDRNTILVWLRATGYGEEYPVRVQCDNCNELFENTFDLSILDTKELDVEPDDKGLFTFTLPQSKKVIKFKLLSCSDESKIVSQLESNKKKMGNQIDTSMTMRMISSVVEIDGNSDFGDIRMSIENMTARDARAFREYMGDVEPGLIMEQECTCSLCGSLSSEVIPIQANFFWPDS